MTPQTEFEILRMQDELYPKLANCAAWFSLVMAGMSVAVAALVFLWSAKQIEIYAVSYLGVVADVEQLDPVTLKRIQSSGAKK